MSPPLMRIRVRKRADAMGGKSQFVIEGVIAALAVSLVGLGAAQAQTTPPNPDPHNLQGTWMNVGREHVSRDFVAHKGNLDPEKDIPGSEVVWPADNRMPPFTAWGRERFDLAVNGQLTSRPRADPSTNCQPHGLPRLMIAPYGVQIVQTEPVIAMLWANNHNVRMIHMNQPMPAKVPLTHNGYSVGHWEGDTLVVHSKGVSSVGVIDQLGTPHSDELQVTERIRKVEGGRVLENMMTFEDPIAFTKPWTARITHDWDNGMRLMESVCEENNRNAPDENGISTAR